MSLFYPRILGKHLDLGVLDKVETDWKSPCKPGLANSKPVITKSNAQTQAQDVDTREDKEDEEDNDEYRGSSF
jgi:hypothetical protein